MARKMKDNGIEWIGEIPEEWRTINPKALFTQRKDKAQKGERQLTSSQQYGILYQDDYMELTGSKVVTVEKDFDILKHVEAGDFVISMRSFQGGLEYSTKSGAISSAYVMLVPNLELVYPRFYRWLLKSSVYIDALQRTTNMVRDGQAMRYSNFAQVRLFTLPLDEQKSRADFLDLECSSIDKMLFKTRSSIEEYKKLKQAVITQAVTKGMRGEREMKDSGVDWIGKIPTTYSICKLKYLLKNPLKYGANESGIPYSDSLPRYIRITDITPDGNLKYTGKLSLSEESAKDYILEDGDILFARSGATVGKTFIYYQSYGRSAYAGYLIKASLNNKVSAKFVYYYTCSSLYEIWKNSIFIQSTIQNIGADRYANLPVPVPKTLQEQEEIADYLDVKCAEIDKLIAKKEQLVKELESYKKSLIYEVVTGKREIFTDITRKSPNI